MEHYAMRFASIRQGVAEEWIKIAHEHVKGLGLVGRCGVLPTCKQDLCRRPGMK